MAEANDANLLLSFFEYRAFFQKPIFNALTNPEPLTALFQSFREWGVSLSDISSNTNPGSLAEYQTTVEFLNRRYSFSVGLGSLRLSVTNPHWEEAEQIAKISLAGLNAICSSTNTEIDQQTVQLGMHLKPRTLPVSELMSSFISSEIASLMSDKILAYGFSLYSEDSVWVVDRSALDKSALFVSLSKSFESKVSMKEIAELLNKEQEKALGFLKLKIVDNED